MTYKTILESTAQVARGLGCDSAGSRFESLAAYRRRLPEEAWGYFQRAAQRLDQEPRNLWRRVGVTDGEPAEPVLPPP
jgi:hypothetical protein